MFVLSFIFSFAIEKKCIIDICFKDFSSRHFSNLDKDLNVDKFDIITLRLCLKELVSQFQASLVVSTIKRSLRQCEPLLSVSHSGNTT